LRRHSDRRDSPRLFSRALDRDTEKIAERCGVGGVVRKGRDDRGDTVFIDVYGGNDTEACRGDGQGECVGLHIE
jgi:hypothetical protein